MTNLPHVIETAVLILVAYLIGCVIGWFLRRSMAGERSAAASIPPSPVATPAPEPVPVAAPTPAPAPLAANPAAEPVPAPAPVVASVPESPPVVEATAAPAAPQPVVTEATTSARPQALDGPRDGKADDLKRISGISPKIEATLNGLGVFHFDQIADWDRKTVDWVEQHLSFPGRIARESWVAQARTLVSGGATEFAKRVDKGEVPSSLKSGARSAAKAADKPAPARKKAATPAKKTGAAPKKKK